MINAIAVLEENIPDKTVGLPEEIFYFIGRITPLVNVDLLIKDSKENVLLAWRDDAYYHGWHIPGGIVRFKETLEQRIQKTAQDEIGISVSFNPKPLTIERGITPKFDNRGHFISILYCCSIPDGFVLNADGKNLGETGYLKWSNDYPDDFIKRAVVLQKIYKTKKYIIEFVRKLQFPNKSTKKQQFRSP
jgi:colanic acid biosynthesis protein WcaH